MVKRKSQLKFKDNETGMTLIEVAMGVIILGLLIVALIPFLNIYKIKKIKDTTVINQTNVARALKRYALTNGRYPRPATRNLKYGDANYGAELPGAMVGSIGNCNWNDPAVCRVSSGVRQFSARAGSERGLIGDVPFATLGIPYTAAIDGYGNRMSYAITEHLTTTGDFRQDWGALRVLNANNVYNINTDKNTSNQAHYVIVSHGKNGAGTFTKNGLLRASCNQSTSLIGSADKENCDRDGVFKNNYDLINSAADIVTKRKGVEVIGTSYYDDYVKHTENLTGQMWAQAGSSVATGSTILNNTAIRIGGAASTTNQMLYHNNNTHSNPRARIQIVTGSSTVPRSIKADELHVTRICSASNLSNSHQNWCSDQKGSSTTTSIPNYYFNPAIIGEDASNAPGNVRANVLNGTRGIKCNSDQAIIDVHRAFQICLANEGNNARVYDTTFRGNLTDCPDGPPKQYPSGVDASGQLICAVPAP